MVKTSILSANIVATPSQAAWSQAYAAGNVFVVLSLKQPDTQDQAETTPLAALGKDILNTFEAEYFTLEEKTLEEIKKAIATTCEKIPKQFHTSFLVAVVKEATQPILYVFVYGSGTILLRRNKQTAAIIQKKTSTTLTAASGYIQDGDTVLLQTPTFLENIPQDEQINALQKSPQEAAELLLPHIHEKENIGAAAALIFSVTHVATQPAFTPEDETLQDYVASQEIPPQPTRWLLAFSSFRIPSFSFPRQFLGKFSKTHLLFLAIACVLVVILIGSILTTLKTQEATNNAQRYKQIMDEAKRKYDEGQSLLSLNKSLARDDFLEAKKIAQQGREKLSPNSQERKMLEAFLKQVNEALGGNVKTVQAVPIDLAQSSLLAIAKQTANLAVTQDEKNVYTINPTEIRKIDKASKKVSTAVKNNNDWSTPAGIGTYGGNLYVVDKKANTIVKFVPSETTYTKSTYLAAGVSVDFTKAVSLAIDGSLYVLYANGTVAKFTRGRQNTFALTGLEIQLKNPTSITTTPDDKFLYILDSAHERIVVFDKSGVLQTQVKADKLAQAKAFDVRESEKKAYFLAEDKIWQLDLP